MNAIEPTTTITNWVRVMRDTLTVGDYIMNFLGDYADEYDLDGLESAYRAAIDEALPEGVSLVGDEFYCDWSRRHDFDLDELREAIAGDEAGVGAIDFWSIAEKFDTTN